MRRNWINGKSRRLEKPLLLLLGALNVDVIGFVVSACLTKDEIEKQTDQEDRTEGKEHEVADAGLTKVREGYFRGSSSNAPPQPSHRDDPASDFPGSYPHGLGMGSLAPIRAHQHAHRWRHPVLPGLKSQKTNLWH